MTTDVLQLVRTEAEARRELYDAAVVKDAGGPVPNSVMRELHLAQRQALDALLAAGDELIQSERKAQR